MLIHHHICQSIEKIIHLRAENDCNNQSRYSPVYFYLLILIVNGLTCVSLEVILAS